jgi:hypothetical protein
MKLPRNVQIWMPNYLEQLAASRGRDELRGQGRVWIAICDHYEPLREATDDTGRERVAAWAEAWPKIADRNRDSVGNPAQYSFFYPEDEYRPFLIEPLARMTHDGWGDVDIHIHMTKEGDSEARFLERMNGFIQNLRDRHGVLRQRNGRTVFGFIHGNWALDNSLHGGFYCGLDQQLTLLRDLGCYADFTMPSAPWESQSSMVNQIFWADDDPRPKSYDRGRPVRVGKLDSGDLLMIPGPLGWRIHERLIPRLENGEVARQDQPNEHRVKLWFDIAPRLGNDIFVKLYAHGCVDAHRNAMLHEGFDDKTTAMDRLYQLVAREANRRGWDFRYVSAWGMFQAVEAAAGYSLETRWQKQAPLEEALLCP